MKISLVVASGTHQGKSIAIPGAQFLIGRDEGCHLRPASPAISKKHCLLFVRDNKAFIRDLESTNGTFVNDEQITGERELLEGDRLRVGPLDFSVLLISGSKVDSTPLPDALKAVGKSGEQKPAPRPTPAPTPKPAPAPAAEDDPDRIAAMLLSMGEDDDAEVPGGSTIMDMPSVENGGEAAADAAAKAEEEKKKKGVPTAAETSAAASDILRRYMRRPR
jgi:pSer/pThr/pTyr-binding forkhead associated (FHA) protein